MCNTQGRDEFRSRFSPEKERSGGTHNESGGLRNICTLPTLPPRCRENQLGNLSRGHALSCALYGIYPTKQAHQHIMVEFTPNVPFAGFGWWRWGCSWCCSGPPSAYEAPGSSDVPADNGVGRWQNTTQTQPQKAPSIFDENPCIVSTATKLWKYKGKICLIDQQHDYHDASATSTKI